MCNDGCAFGGVLFSVCLFQIEVLTPLVAICEPFKEQYKSFAASLDATRHELLIKNIHIEGDKQAYLGMKISFIKFTFSYNGFMLKKLLTVLLLHLSVATGGILCALRACVDMWTLSTAIIPCCAVCNSYLCLTT